MTPCILCSNDKLTFARKPLGTRRGAVVYVCPRCGLLQSRFGPDQVAEARGDGVARPSCLADYGNLRTGKGGRAAHAMDVLSEHLKAPPRRVLDVGSSRGHFVRALLEKFPDCEVDALEPDISLLESSGSYPRLRMVLMPYRIENFTSAVKYDLIHCSHTLEHLSDPLGQLKRLAGILAPGGFIYVEVPDVGDLMNRNDLIEELFLDKHVTHWSMETLSLIMVEAGLSDVASASDSEHLWSLGVPCSGQEGIPAKLEEPMRAVTSLEKHGKILAVNKALLEQAVPRLNERLTGKKAVAMGAGRILDALRLAGLDLSLFEAVVDSASPLEEFHGLHVVRPPMLAEIRPDVVLVCSRSSTGEMAETVREMVPDAEIIYWNELLKGA